MLPKKISGQFHSHLTLSASKEEAQIARNLIGGKVTIIELERAEREQVDVMLTNYYVTGFHDLKDSEDVLVAVKARAKILRENGVEVKRVKLEHEILESLTQEEIQLSLEKSSYVEVHIKVEIASDKNDALKAAMSERGWHPSRNPRDKMGETVLQFINRRFYDETNYQRVEDEVKNALDFINMFAKVRNVSIETAIYDSNDELDRWWMER